MKTYVSYALLGIIWLLALPFALYAAGFGWRGLTEDLSGESYLFAGPFQRAEGALSWHMLAGAVVTCLVPLQLLGRPRLRWPFLHHWTGYVIAGCAVVAAVGGLVFILVNGTIGGTLMDLGFALYGVLMLVAAVQTVRHARGRRFEVHQVWALRLAVLCLASWFYRVHYGVWYAATGGVGSRPDFTGLFDQIQVFAFFLPYLVLVEFWRWRRAGAASPVG